MSVQENTSQAENASSGESVKTASDYEYPEMTIILAHSSAVADVGQESTFAIETYIEGTPGGKIQVDVYPAGQLGDSNTLIEPMQNDGIQICIQPPANVRAFDPLLSILDVLYFFPPDIDKIRAVFETDAADALLDTIRDYDVVGLGYWVGLFKTFTNNVSLCAPEGFSRLKSHVMTPLVPMKFTEPPGGTALIIDYQETFTALQTGVIGGQEAGIGAGIYNMEFCKVWKYMETINRILTSQLIFISKAQLEGSDDPCKQLVMDTVNTAGSDAYQKMRGDIEQAVLDAIGTQHEVTTLTDEELQIMSDACCQPYLDLYIESNGEADQRILDAFSADIEKLSQQTGRVRKGYEYMNKTYEKYKTLDKTFKKFELTFYTLSILFVTFLATLGIVLKDFFGFSFPWVEELCQYITAWVAYISGVISIEKREHVGVDIVYNMLPQRLHSYYCMMLTVIATVFLAALAYFSYLEVVSIRTAVRTSMIMPQFQIWWMYLGTTMGYGLMALEYFKTILVLFEGDKTKAGVNARDQDPSKPETM